MRNLIGRLAWYFVLGVLVLCLSIRGFRRIFMLREIVLEAAGRMELAVSLLEQINISSQYQIGLTAFLCGINLAFVFLYGFRFR